MKLKFNLSLLEAEIESAWTGALEHAESTMPTNHPVIAACAPIFLFVFLSLRGGWHVIFSNAFATFTLRRFHSARCVLPSHRFRSARAVSTIRPLPHFSVSTIRPLPHFTVSTTFATVLFHYFYDPS